MLELRDVPNAAPIMEAVAPRLIAPGQSFYQQVWATDADNDWVTYSAIGLPQGLTINPDTGTVTGMLPVGVFQHGQELQVTYSASDGKGGIANQVSMLIITGPANVWVVNTVHDTNDLMLGDMTPADGDGKISLRAAIEQANFNRQFSVLPTYITFDPTIFTNPTTITLGLGKLPPITADLTITGTGMNNLFIGGGAGNNEGMLQIGMSGVTPLPVAVVIRDLTLQNGTNEPRLQGGVQKVGRGGAIENYWNAFLDSVQIRGSSADEGGAVYSTYSLTLIDSLLKSNSAVGNVLGYGGGLATSAGHVTIIGITIEDNTADTRGAGISLRATGKVFLLDSSLIHNVAASDGGGVYNSGAGVWFQMNGGRIERNESGNDGGGIRNSGTALFKGVTFDSNKAVQHGGGVDAVTGTCILTTCTFIGNHQAAIGPKVAKRAGDVFFYFDCTGLAEEDIVLYTP